jgi:phosphoglycolate phosphatase-like HAD superfamily hydrolase
VTIKHIIFDCDGVLIDSEEISMAVDRRLLAENGVHLSEGEMHQRFVGKTFAAMISESGDADSGLVMPAGPGGPQGCDHARGLCARAEAHCRCAADA